MNDDELLAWARAFADEVGTKLPSAQSSANLFLWAAHLVRHFRNDGLLNDGVMPSACRVAAAYRKAEQQPLSDALARYTIDWIMRFCAAYDPETTIETMPEPEQVVAALRAVNPTGKLH